MNKLLIALGLAATVALVGCNKQEAPETGATTGEHLENAANQASHDISDATKEAEAKTQAAAEEATSKIEAAGDEAAAKTEAAAENVKEAAKDGTAKAAGAVEEGASNVREKAQQ